MSATRKNEIRIGAVLSYLAIAINIITALVYSPWMLQMIGDSNYGLYSLANSLISLFLLDFGISSAVSRFTSKYLAEGRKDEVAGLLGTVYRLFFGISSIIAVVLIVVYFFIEEIYIALTPTELVIFKNVYVIVALFNVFSFPLSATVNGILTSYEKFISPKLIDVICKVVSVLLIVVALLCGYGIYALVTIQAVVNLICLLIKFFLVKKETNIDLGHHDKALIKEIFSFSIWVLINSICSRLVLNMCPNILGITAGTLQITIFSFASVLEGYTYTFASAIDGMFIPKISRILYGNEENNRNEQFLSLMIKVGKFQFGLTGLVLAGFFCLGQDFISLWIGKEYLDVFYCALLLIIPVPFYVSQQIGKSAMIVSSNVKYITIINVVKAGLNLVGVFILSKLIGAIGACISICVVYCLRNIANLVMFKRVLKISIEKFVIECNIRMMMPVVLTALLGYFICRAILMGGWMGLGIKVVTVTIIYILFVMLFIGKEERHMILSRIKR